LSDKDHIEHDNIREAMRHLSLCHTIMINPDNNEFIWQSPDEFELVSEVGHWHMEFNKRDQHNNIEITEGKGSAK
jgi:magnesium-transporting ATPase (P-type)